METLDYYKKNNPKLKAVIAYQKYLSEDINIEKQFQKYYGQGNNKLVDWEQMDFEVENEGIGFDDNLILDKLPLEKSKLQDMLL